MKPIRNREIFWITIINFSCFLWDRSRVKRSSGLVYVLTPFLNESYVKFGNGFTLMQRPNITFVNHVSLNVAFGLLENLPGSGPNDTVKIFLKFGTANNPLVLSGRPLYLTALLNFDAGSDSSSKKFKIIGPLLKPLLSINKTVKVRTLIPFDSLSKWRGIGHPRKVESESLTTLPIIFILRNLMIFVKISCTKISSIPVKEEYKTSDKTVPPPPHKISS